MAGTHIPKLDVVTEPEYREVGANNTPMTKFTGVENNFKKTSDGKWELKWKKFWNCIVWGDAAVEAQLLSKGTTIDLSAQIRTGKDGDYVSHRAYTDENTYTNKDGEEVTNTQLVINELVEIEYEED